MLISATHTIQKFLLLSQRDILSKRLCRERCFRVGNFSRELDSGVVAICLFNRIAYLFQANGVLAFRSRICDRTFPIKMLAKATAI